MREIKFRGWSDIRKDWVYGSLILDNHPDVHTALIQHNSETDIYERYKSQVIYDSVGQFTGLKDKNGKEIYEGDIISLEKNASLYNNCPIIVIGVVFYNQGKYEVDTKNVTNKKFTNKESRYFATKVMDWIHIPEFIKSEVIGNIYDNPELLN